ncbi:hypothetical protein [Croceiramulus getboli]|nr:hypothetical protein P8624_07775 [Flavobacteriaceae bacterium YJPT1-3]
MLKLEDFKIKEIETLDSVTGGGEWDTIYASTRTLYINGWKILSYETGGDWCSGCDQPEPQQ